MSKPDLRVTVGGLRLQNPIIVASGTFGSSDEYANFVDLDRLGAVITKSITLNARAGNKSPRICETASGMLNAIGLENKGVEYFLKTNIPFFKKYTTKLIVSIAGSTVHEYERLAHLLNRERRVDALEVNISCPNVKKGGIAFVRDVHQSRSIVEQVKKEFARPVFVKISPEARDVEKLVHEVMKAGCDGISLINTIKGMAVDSKTRRPQLGNITGGLSGPAIKPIAIRYLYEIKQRFNIPVIAGGGIMNANDALEFLIVGADAVSLGTANFVNPQVSMEVIEELTKYLKEEKIKSVRDIIGTLTV
ncbi:MAG: dihydroorotate dehydrogenase [Candidatus Omnitrophica bacterium]|nr:dihydroorotate dehydrogenase [Candidatus Omnitrophota bacterium]